MAAAQIAIIALGIYWFLGGREERHAEYLRPDGRYRIVVYRKPSVFGMAPGQASDAPGRIVLLDASGRELRETDVEMVQLVEEVQWGDQAVSAKLLFGWKLPD